MFRWKIDVLEALKNNGYSSYRIRKDGVINQTALQKLRSRKMIAWEQLNVVCNLLHCQPCDLIEHIPDDTSDAE